MHTADALQSGSGSGIMQNRYPFERSAWAGIYNSTAMNADTAFAIWRACFEGYAHWLNTFERGGRIQR